MKKTMLLANSSTCHTLNSPWSTFSELDKDIREKSYVTRGGQLSINTPQQQIQDRRESLELMVVYTDPKDIPPSPKEPPQAHRARRLQRSETLVNPAPRGLSNGLQEIYQYGPAVAMSNFVRRLENANR